MVFEFNGVKVCWFGRFHLSAMSQPEAGKLTAISLFNKSVPKGILSTGGIGNIPVLFGYF
jgi:hypothetical protein